MKKLLQTSLLVLFAIATLIYAVDQWKIKKIHRNQPAQLSKRTRMDLAMQQEFERTKDPNLNTVPRHRLYEAFRQKELMAPNNIQPLAAIVGVNWKERGPNNLGGRTRAIMIDPNDVSNNSIFAASIAGGLWKTNDITQVNPGWASVNDFFENLAITTLAYDPTNTNIMYFGTGEGFFNIDAVQGNGIWRSTDGGDNWTQLSETITDNFNTCAGAGDCDFLYVNKIIVTSTGTVLVATRSRYNNRGGIMRSTDNGDNWTKVLTGNGSNDWASDIEVAADGTVFASFGIFSNGGIWRSTDDGASWGASPVYTSAADEERIEIAVAPSDEDYVYALVQDANTAGINQIMRSTNGGDNWNPVSTPQWLDQDCGAPSNDFTRTQAWYDLTLAVDPNDRETVYIGGVDVLRTSDGGSSWTQMTNWAGNCDLPEMHADQHTILYQPGSSDVIYFGNDGGVYLTNNGSATNPTFTRKEFGYNTSQFYSIAMHPTAYSPNFIGGTQDNGSSKVTSLGVASIVEVTGGDGAFTHIDQDEPNYQFTSFPGLSVARSTDGGLTFETLFNFGGDSFINPTDYADADNNFYGGYVAGQYAFSTDIQGASNVFSSGDLTDFNSGQVTAVTASPNTSELIFIGLSNGRVIRVDDAATAITTTNITAAGFPSGSVSCIAIEEGDDDHLLVTFFNYGVTSVWETTNGGTSWTAVEGNLPDMPVRWALFNPSNSDEALIATELGVWSTDNLDGASTVWEASNSGLANVRTDMLQIRSSDNLVVAATHGRGIFTSDIFASEHADFVADKKAIYAESTVNFTDASYKATSWLWDFGDGGFSTEANPSHTYMRSGMYEVTLTINGSGDSETKTDYIHVLPNVAIPFSTADGGNFETNANYFGSDDLTGGINLWERGTPGNALTTVNSGTNVWKTSLSSDITQADYSCALYSPNFNFTEAGTYTLSFRKSMEVAFANAPIGVQVQYSTDNGANWTRLGDDNSGTNWYERGLNSTFSMETDVIHDRIGFSNFYTNQNTAHDVSFLAGNSTVAFRIVLYVNGGYNSGYTVDGFMIDDFEITGPSNEANVNITENDPGTQLTFNGISEYTTLSNLQINESFTAEMWLAPTSDADGQTFLAKHDASGNDIFKIGYNNGGIEVDIRGTATSGGTKATGLQHLAVTVDRINGTTSEITVYVDGVEQYQNMINEVLGNSDGLDWVIGQDWDGVGVPSDFYDGTIDELRIWNSVRTEVEIRENNFLIVDGLDTDLVGYWQFNEETGATTQNVITSNEGVLTGSTWDNSEAPVGKGSSYSSSVNTDGTVVLSPGLSIDFVGVSGSFDVVCFEIENTPIGILPGDENVLTEVINSPYYIINTYGAGTFALANLTYTYGSGAFTETNPASFFLFKRDSKSNQTWDMIIPATSINPLTGEASFLGITSFSQTTVGASSQPLPVEFVHFAAERENEVTNLNWSTATETNNDRFEVMRKAGGGLWQSIGTIDSKAIGGESNELLNYEFKDRERMFEEDLYYQIKQIDFDGTASFSQIVLVKNPFALVSSLKTYPNPVVSDLHVELLSNGGESGQLEIITLGGKQKRFREYMLNKGINTLTMELSALDPGIYILRIKSDQVDKYVRIVKR